MPRCPVETGASSRDVQPCIEAAPARDAQSRPLGDLRVILIVPTRSDHFSKPPIIKLFTGANVTTSRILHLLLRYRPARPNLIGWLAYSERQARQRRHGRLPYMLDNHFGLCLDSMRIRLQSRAQRPQLNAPPDPSADQHEGPR